MRRNIQITTSHGGLRDTVKTPVVVDNNVVEKLLSEDKKMVIKIFFDFGVYLDVIPEALIPKLIFHGMGSAVKGSMMQLFNDLKRSGLMCPQLREVATDSLEQFKVPKNTSDDKDASMTPINVKESEEYKQLRKDFETLKNKSNVKESEGYKKLEKEFETLKTKSKDEYNKLRETSKQKVKGKNEEIENLKKEVKKKDELIKEKELTIKTLEQDKEDMTKLATENTERIGQVMKQNETFIEKNEKLKKRIEELEMSSQPENNGEGQASSAVVRIKKEIPDQTNPIVLAQKKCQDCIELKDVAKKLKQLEPKYNAKKELIKLRDQEIMLKNNEYKQLYDELKQVRIELCRKHSAEDGIVMLN